MTNEVRPEGTPPPIAPEDIDVYKKAFEREISEQDEIELIRAEALDKLNIGQLVILAAISEKLSKEKKEQIEKQSQELKDKEDEEQSAKFRMELIEELKQITFAEEFETDEIQKIKSANVFRLAHYIALGERKVLEGHGGETTNNLLGDFAEVPYDQVREIAEKKKGGRQAVKIYEAIKREAESIVGTDISEINKRPPLIEELVSDMPEGEEKEQEKGKLIKNKRQTIAVLKVAVLQKRERAVLEIVDQHALQLYVLALYKINLEKAQDKMREEARRAETTIREEEVRGSGSAEFESRLQETPPDPEAQRREESERLKSDYDHEREAMSQYIETDDSSPTGARYKSTTSEDSIQRLNNFWLDYVQSLSETELKTLIRDKLHGNQYIDNFENLSEADIKNLEDGRWGGQTIIAPPESAVEGAIEGDRQEQRKSFAEQFTENIKVQREKLKKKKLKLFRQEFMSIRQFAEGKGTNLPGNFEEIVDLFSKDMIEDGGTSPANDIERAKALIALYDEAGIETFKIPKTKAEAKQLVREKLRQEKVLFRQEAGLNFIEAELSEINQAEGHLKLERAREKDELTLKLNAILSRVNQGSDYKQEDLDEVGSSIRELADLDFSSGTRIEGMRILSQELGFRGLIPEIDSDQIQAENQSNKSSIDTILRDKLTGIFRPELTAYIGTGGDGRRSWDKFVDSFSDERDAYAVLQAYLTGLGESNYGLGKLCESYLETIAEKRVKRMRLQGTIIEKCLLAEKILNKADNVEQRLKKIGEHAKPRLSMEAGDKFIDERDAKIEKEINRETKQKRKNKRTKDSKQEKIIKSGLQRRFRSGETLIKFEELLS